MARYWRVIPDFSRENLDDCIDLGVIGIGYDIKVSNGSLKDDVKDKIRDFSDKYEYDWDENAIAQHAGNVLRFLRFGNGDGVVLYDINRSIRGLGIVTDFKVKRKDLNLEMNITKKVKWIHEFEPSLDISSIISKLSKRIDTPLCVLEISKSDWNKILKFAENVAKYR